MPVARIRRALSERVQGESARMQDGAKAGMIYMFNWLQALSSYSW